MSLDPRRTSEEAKRNEASIWRVIERAIGRRPQGRALELGSGSGEHCLAWAGRAKGMEWQPSDLDPIQRASVDAWCQRLPQVRAAIALDASSLPWPIEPPLTLIVMVHVLHLAPTGAIAAVFTEARRLLAPGGALVIHDAFIDDAGRALSPRMQEFDARLRSSRGGLPTRSALDRAATGLTLAEARSYDDDQTTLAFLKG